MNMYRFPVHLSSIHYKWTILGKSRLIRRLTNQYGYDFVSDQCPPTLTKEIIKRDAFIYQIYGSPSVYCSLTIVDIPGGAIIVCFVITNKESTKINQCNDDDLDKERKVSKQEAQVKTLKDTHSQSFFFVL